jgi:monoamine oxidase
MTDESWDIIVVGGGLAGLTAARELRRKGRGVLLLEARDRLGGRTWTAPFSGIDVEYGGTWIHWTHPHIWTEVTRYGLEVGESPAFERVLVHMAGQVHDLSIDEFAPLFDEGWEKVATESRELVPRPYQPLWNADIEKADQLSASDALERAALSPEIHDVINSALGSFCSAPIAEGGYSIPLRWYALAGWNTATYWDAMNRYKLEAGTRSLVDAMISDGRPEVSLSSALAEIKQTDGRVSVRTIAGDVYSARSVIVTAPLNTLDSIEFVPQLPLGKRQAIARGQASRGVKAWATIKGIPAQPYFGFAPDSFPFTAIQSEYFLEDRTVVLCFGPRGDDVDVDDREAVERGIRVFVPDAEVLESGGHNWSRDPFTRGTWPVFRPGQLTQDLPELQRPEGRVVFAGSEVANGWSGFMDGAIESGMTAARQVREIEG